MKVALLTNMLPPYRLDFYSRLAERCELLVIADTAIEATRNWAVDVESLPFRCEVIGSEGVRKTRRRKDLGYSEDHIVHFGAKIPSILADFAPDVVVSGEMGMRSLRAARYCKKSKIPLLLWWEGTLHTEAAEPWYKRWLRRYLVGRASGFWSNGKESTSYLASLGGDPAVAQEGMTGVATEGYRDGVAAFLPKRDDIRSECGVSGCVFLFVGSLSGRKGIPQLLEAAGKAYEQGLRDFSLLFVGEGEHRPDIEAFAEGHSDVQVHIAGFVAPEEIHKYYAAGDVFVLPTLLDNWPLVTIEAIASGLPEMFSCYNGGSADVCEDECYGLVFDPLEVKGFVSGLVKMREREGVRIEADKVEKMVDYYSPESQAVRGFKSICDARARTERAGTNSSSRALGSVRHRQKANRFLQLLAKVFGMRIRDPETGDVLGKAIVIPWRGTIHIIGYGHEKPLTVGFLPNGRVSYWRQRIGFGTHEEPDFGRAGSKKDSGESEGDGSKRVATVMLTHQEPAKVERMVAYWRQKQDPFYPVIAYGGPREHFEEVRSLDAPAVFVDDPRLHTLDHPRERQSYLGVIKAVMPELDSGDWGYVHMVEYDEVPVVQDVQQILVERVEEDRADMLACELKRIDGTNAPHWLSHLDDPKFGEYWARLSCRKDSGAGSLCLGLWDFLEG